MTIPDEDRNHGLSRRGRKTDDIRSCIRAAGYRLALEPPAARPTEAVVYNVCLLQTQRLSQTANTGRQIGPIVAARLLHALRSGIL
jgi:hypothetical protein